jgi:hypothetical protein
MTADVTTATAATREVTAADLPELCTTLAAAFHDDPVFTWWIADDVRRQQILPEFFRVITESSLPLGGLYATEDLACGAVWSPPGAEDDEDVIPALAEVSGEYANELFEILELMMEKPRQGAVPSARVRGGRRDRAAGRAQPLADVARASLSRLRFHGGSGVVPSGSAAFAEIASGTPLPRPRRPD